MEVRYTTTSVGGKRAVQALAVAIATQVDADQSKPVPIVMLGKEHYSHKSYGRIYTPIFEIQSWVSMDVETKVEAKKESIPKDDSKEVPWPKDEPAVEAAPATRRRRGA
jgi:hypothetical protein